MDDEHLEMAKRNVTRGCRRVEHQRQIVIHQRTLGLNTDRTDFFHFSDEVFYDDLDQANGEIVGSYDLFHLLLGERECHRVSGHQVLQECAFWSAAEGTTPNQGAVYASLDSLHAEHGFTVLIAGGDPRCRHPCRAMGQGSRNPGRNLPSRLEATWLRCGSDPERASADRRKAGPISS